MLEAKDDLATLRASGLFAGTDARLLKKFAQGTVIRHLKCGETVWRTGEKPKHFVLVQTGLVAIQKLDLEGSSVLVGLFGPGDTLCIAPALQGIDYPGDAVAISETVTLLLIPVAPVAANMATNAQLSYSLNRSLVKHSELLRNKIDIVSAGTVPRRLAALMLNLVDRFGVSDSQDRASVPIIFTRERLGQLINARTETVIRVMSKWQKAGWFRSSSQGFHIKRLEVLRRIVHGRPPSNTP